MIIMIIYSQINIGYFNVPIRNKISKIKVVCFSRRNIGFGVRAWVRRRRQTGSHSLGLSSSSGALDVPEEALLLAEPECIYVGLH